MKGADKEKVIKLLEACVNSGNKCPHDCPLYAVDDCNLVMAREALAAIRADEVASGPRVLTLEEVREHKPFVLWAEDMDTGALLFPVALIDGRYRDYALDWAVNIDIHDSYDSQDYGKRWRLWNGKPTHEQREATAWT